MPSTLGTDFVIHGNGRLVAAVEVKNLPDLSPDSAVAVRRDMVAHDVVPPAPYFLLVSEDRAYLWVGHDRLDSDAPPTHELPMKRVVDRYFPDRPRARLRGAELELLVLIWLGELSSADNGLSNAEAALVRSGFADAIRGATVTRAVA